jgi:hypothetical protein
MTTFVMWLNVVGAAANAFVLAVGVGGWPNALCFVASATGALLMLWLRTQERKWQ